MSKIEQFLNLKLQQRIEDHSIRRLKTSFPPVDFCSNDYIGFARSAALKESIADALSKLPEYRNGSGGSRLLSGNTLYVEETEQFIADFHKAVCGLIFNSGYDANVGLLSCIPQRSDTIITDELIHASIIDGCRLSHATRYKFVHNDLNDLEGKIRLAKGNIFVVIESVYSMDGDIPPLIEIASLCEKYGANLIVDEAHATGIFGTNGQGLIHQYGLTEQVFARIVTFGKAIGTHGAIVLGSKKLREYLINFARSFIYTTAAPLHSIVTIRCAYQLLQQFDVQSILDRIDLFRKVLAEKKIVSLDSISPIQGIVFSTNEETKVAALKLQEHNFDVRAILSPTVPKGKERLRICLHTFNTEQEIIDLTDHLINING